MNRNTLRLAGMVALALLAAVAKADTVNVSVGPNGSMTFSPQQVFINVGDTVKWTWGSTSHSVTSTSGSELNSGLHNSGFVYTHTFMSEGNFSYFCTFHGPIMNGSVTVSAAATPSPTP